MKHLWLLGILLAGCTNYNETRTVEFHFSAEGGSSVDMKIEGVDVATTRDTGQEATSEADLDAALSQMGSSLAKAGKDAILEDIVSRFKAEANPVDNSTTTTPTIAKPAPPEKPVVIDPGKPVIIDPEKPKPEEPGDMFGFSDFMTLFHTGDKMSYNSVWQDKIVFKGKIGTDFGPSLMIRWSDGNTLKVPNTSTMAWGGESGGFRKYQPGGSLYYDPPRKDMPWMEVYAARGTHPKSVTIFFNEVKK